MEDLSRDDNFFALSGHSLEETLAVSRARTIFDREIDMDTLFQNPTAAGPAGGRR